MVDSLFFSLERKDLLYKLIQCLLVTPRIYSRMPINAKNFIYFYIIFFVANFSNHFIIFKGKQDSLTPF